MSKTQKILLKRTQNSLENAQGADTSLEFGEPFVISSNNNEAYLSIGPVGSSTVSDGVFIKGQPSSRVDNGVFYTDETPVSIENTHYLQNEYGYFYPVIGEVTADDVTCDLSVSGTTYTDVNSVLQEITTLIDTAVPRSTAADTVKAKFTNNSWTEYYVTGIVDTSNIPDTPKDLWVNQSVYFTNTGVLYGAAWNDFAEYRKSDTNMPGLCVVEDGKGNLVKSSNYNQPCAYVISDTYGMVIGKHTDGSVPVAVAGRVLAYVEDSDKLQAGDALKTAPNGLLAKMKRHEIRRYPDRIVGYVSEIPEYEEWNGVKVLGRVWVRI